MEARANVLILQVTVTQSQVLSLNHALSLSQALSLNLSLVTALLPTTHSRLVRLNKDSPYFNLSSVALEVNTGEGSSHLNGKSLELVV